MVTEQRILDKLGDIEKAIDSIPQEMPPGVDLRDIERKLDRMIQILERIARR